MVLRIICYPDKDHKKEWSQDVKIKRILTRKIHGKMEFYYEPLNGAIKHLDNNVIDWEVIK